MCFEDAAAAALSITHSVVGILLLTKPYQHVGYSMNEEFGTVGQGSIEVLFSGLSWDLLKNVQVAITVHFLPDVKTVL